MNADYEKKLFSLIVALNIQRMRQQKVIITNTSLEKVVHIKENTIIKILNLNHFISPMFLFKAFLENHCPYQTLLDWSWIEEKVSIRDYEQLERHYRRVRQQVDESISAVRKSSGYNKAKYSHTFTAEEEEKWQTILMEEMAKYMEEHPENKL